MAQALTSQKKFDATDETEAHGEAANPVESAVARKTSNPTSHPSLPNGQLLASAGSSQQPVVRHWQELIGASFAADEWGELPERWNPRQSVPFLALLSIALWGLLFIGALEII